MDPDDPRWVEVTPSQFTHEAEGLRLVRELLPSIGPYRAWSNFEFRDAHGKWYEVDFLVLGRRRMHLVELKYYTGTLTGDDHRWWRDQRDTEDSPLKLARRKAQRLASKLQDSLRDLAREKPGLKIPDVHDVVPFVQEAVYLHHPGLRCALPAACRMDLFGLDGQERDMGLPGISQRLLEAPTDRHAVPPRRDELITKLMRRIGIVARRQREVGSWIIDEEPLAEGEGWHSRRAVFASRNAAVCTRLVPRCGAPLIWVPTTNSMRTAAPPRPWGAGCRSTAAARWPGCCSATTAVTANLPVSRCETTTSRSPVRFGQAQIGADEVQARRG